MGGRDRALSRAIVFGQKQAVDCALRQWKRRLGNWVPGVPGLFPVGEGAGYAGGIVSAAVDGLRTARAIVAKYARIA